MDATFWRQSRAVRRDVSCLFLDRDGVIVEDVGYLHRTADVRLLPGAAALVGQARAQGWAVGVVTNQSGVGRGYYDWAAFEAVQAEIVQQLGLGPEPFDFVAACGTHADALRPALRVADHPWRKPNPGMLQHAADRLSLRLPASVMIGDRLSDMQAGAAAGVGTLVHLGAGASQGLQDAPRRVIAKADLVEVVSTIGLGFQT